MLFLVVLCLLRSIPDWTVRFAGWCGGLPFRAGLRPRGLEEREAGGKGMRGGRCSPISLRGGGAAEIWFPFFLFLGARLFCS